MIFNQRIKRDYEQFINNDMDYFEFSGAITISRDGDAIKLKYGDKAFMTITDRMFAQMTDDHKRAVGVSVTYKYALYAHLQELGRVKDYFDYAKSHGLTVRNGSYI